MDITDIVRVKADGRTLRIAAFYCLSQNAAGVRILAPCMPDYPRCLAVHAVGRNHEYHKPFELEYLRPSSRPLEWIDRAREKHRRSVERYVSGTRLNERFHHEILRPFLTISNHELLLLDQWRKSQAARFNSLPIPARQPY